jgi:hypothetical protein
MNNSITGFRANAPWGEQTRQQTRNFIEEKQIFLYLPIGFS